MRYRLWPVLLFWLLVIMACAPADKQKDVTPDDSVVYDLRVDSDEVFGFARDSEIGSVYFSDSVGLVGTRIRCQITLDEIDRFQDAVLTGSLSLVNTNAIKDPDFLITFDVDSEKTEFEFYIPQILSIPTYLNFEFLLYYEEENEDGNLDVFEAGFDYQFKVNQGTPAT